MATEAELPDKLVKLEIAPLMPKVMLIDNNLPIELNPFYKDELVKSSSTTNCNHTSSKKNRRFRPKRPSESALDELNRRSLNAISDSAECPLTSLSGVIKHTLKKSTTSLTGSKNRKVILREPILKALQICLHTQSYAQKQLFPSVTTTKTTSASIDVVLKTKGMSDFRDLIDECRNLLVENVDFSGKVKQLSLSNRNSKDFTKIQTVKGKYTHNSDKTKTTVLSTAKTSLLSTENTTLNGGVQSAHGSTILLQPAILGSSISGTNSQQRTINNTVPEQISNHARSNTSCSQQAGNSAAATSSDDVTIDELASYFDTFVYIPKKMSSMAEMMYI